MTDTEFFIVSSLTLKFVTMIAAKQMITIR